MNHRRKRTTRRELKRNSRKKLRGAEKAAMNGHNPDTVALEWRNGKMNADVPIVNDVPRHRKVGGKRPPKKEKCRAGGAHTWVYSTEDHEEHYVKSFYGHCERCHILFKEWERMKPFRVSLTGLSAQAENPYKFNVERGWCNYHGEKVFYTVTTAYRKCSKCATVKKVSQESDRWSADYRARKRLAVPRREVKLY